MQHGFSFRLTHVHAAFTTRIMLMFDPDLHTVSRHEIGTLRARAVHWSAANSRTNSNWICRRSATRIRARRVGRNGTERDDDSWRCATPDGMSQPVNRAER